MTDLTEQSRRFLLARLRATPWDITDEAADFIESQAAAIDAMTAERDDAMALFHATEKILRAKLKEEREAGRRDGIWQAADADWFTGIMEVPDQAPEFLSPWQRGLCAGLKAKRDAILAMIGDPK